MHLVKPCRNPDITIKHEFHGVVVSVSSEEFTARVWIAGDDEEEEIWDFNYDLVKVEDLNQVHPGAGFSCYLMSYPDAEENVFELYFRRLPPWTLAELERAQEAAISDAALVD